MLLFAPMLRLGELPRARPPCTDADMCLLRKACSNLPSTCQHVGLFLDSTAALLPYLIPPPSALPRCRQKVALGIASAEHDVATEQAQAAGAVTRKQIR